MTDERLAELERLANAATPGPWFPRWGGEPGYITSSVAQLVIAEIDGDKNDALARHDSKFIAESRAAVPELIAEVRRLRADAQTLYNQLYDVCMGESAWEWCDELRANYPQYEAAREASDATP